MSCKKGLQPTVVEEGERIERTDAEKNYFLKQLEARIGNFPFTIEIVSSFISPTRKESETVKDVKMADEVLLKRIKESSGDIFLEAAKFQNQNVLKFLARCGVDVNYKDGNSYTAADFAWRNRDYKILLLLLENDSFFPLGFNVNELSDDNVEAKKLLKLVEARKRLHEIIEDSDANEVKKLKLNKNLKLYVNLDNDSAAYIALKYKKFVTYAYLKSIGVELAKREEIELKRLIMADKVALQDAMIQYFPPVLNAHIFYLVSKTRSQKPIEKLVDVVTDYYTKLNQVPEISIILKTLQYADYLDIIFDFDEEEISNVNPTVSDYTRTRGETRYKDGRIYVAAGSNRLESEILGTLAHELTHMAMQVLYENDCNPYGTLDEEAVNHFLCFKNRIRETIKSNTGPSKILVDALDNYRESDHDSELIVRVPHILMQYCNGGEWLKNNVPDLIEFYKKNVEPKCEEFIKESFVLKPKNTIRSINECFGEILKLKSYEIRFKNLGAVADLLKDVKNIFLYEVENTFLGVIKVVQEISGDENINSYNNFLVLKFKNLLAQTNEIMEAFVSDASNIMVIEVDEIPTNEKLYKLCKTLYSLYELKPNKKIVFVTRHNCTKFLLEMLKDIELMEVCVKMSEKDFSLDDLDAKSQKQILSKRILFQGRPTTLKSLIKDENLYKYITGDVLVILLNNGRVTIGNEVFGLSSWDGPYSDISMQMNFEAFARHVKNPENIFLIRSNLETDVEKYFNSQFEKEWVNAEFALNKVYNFEKKINNEKLILVNDNFDSKDFKSFCRINSGKKCHLIDVKNLETDSFILQELYNPDFYVKRKIRIKCIKLEEMKKLLNECRPEKFIISGEKNEAIANYSNVFWSSEGNDLETLHESGTTTHLFEANHEKFIWKNSCGSLRNLRNFFRYRRLGKEEEKQEIASGIDSTAFEESDLFAELGQKKVVIIADNPGMGKSTTMTKLYEAKLISDAHWIIRINLKDHLEAVRDHLHDLSVKKVIKFIEDIDQSLKNELNATLLKVALSSQKKLSKFLLLAFDGFDELLDESDRKKVMNLFKFLAEETFCKIWITSRLQYKQELENLLETFALEFEPFDEGTVKLFTEKYLKDRLNLILREELYREYFNNKEGSKISAFTTSLLLKMENIFQGNVRKFIGTPLQLNLVLPGSVEYFLTWNNIAEFDFLGSNLLEIYENFIEKKYGIYFRKFNIKEKVRQKKDKKDSEVFNKKLAKSLVYHRKPLTPEEDDKEWILLFGIVQSVNGENFEFIHFTFREYYFAQIFAEYVLSETFPESFHDKMFFLFEEIFVKKQYEMIRHFLNIKLNAKLPERKLEELTNFFLQNKDRLMEPFTTSDSFLAILACRGFKNIFHLIYSIYCRINSMRSYRLTSILNQQLIFQIRSNSQLQIWSLLFKFLINFNLEGKWENLYCHFLIGMCIYFAINGGGPDFEYELFQILKEMFLNDRISFFTTFFFKYRNVCQEIIVHAHFPELVDLIIKIALKYLSKQKQYDFLIMIESFNGPNSLFLAATRKDSKFMEFLLANIEIIMTTEEQRELYLMKDASGRTILHQAVRYKNLEILKLLFSKIETIFNPPKQAEYLMLRDKHNWTALDFAVNYNCIKTVKFLVQKGEKLFNTNIFFEYLSVRSPRYEYQDKYRVQSLEKLFSTNIFFEYVSVRSPTDKHFCRLDRYMEIIEFLLNKIAESFSVEDRCRWLLIFWSHSLDSMFRQPQCGYRMHFTVEKLKEISNSKKIGEFFLMKNSTNSTCLHLAIQYSKIEFLRSLFNDFENFLPVKDRCEVIRMRDSDGRTIFHNAGMQNDPDILKFLLEKTEDLLASDEMLELLKLKDCGKITFFHLLVQNFPVKSFIFVLEKLGTLGVQPFLFLNEHTILLAALRNQDPDVSKLILEKFADLEEQCKWLAATDVNETCLHVAAEENQIEFIRLFFGKIGNILSAEDQCQLIFRKNQNGNTILHEAAIGKQTLLLELLFEKMSQILTVEKQREFFMMTNASGKTVLYLSSENFYSMESDAVKLILKKAEDLLTYEQQCEFFCNTFVFEQDDDMFSGDSTLFLKMCLDVVKRLLKVEDQVKLMTKAEDYSYFGNPVFHAIFVSVCDYRTLKTLLEYIEEVFPSETQREILMMTNKENQTVLHAVLSIRVDIQYEIVEVLLEKLENILTPKEIQELFMMEDDYLGSIYHAALYTDKELDVVKLLFNKAMEILNEDFNQVFFVRNSKKETILHAATLGNTYKVNKFVLNTAKKLLTSEKLKKFLQMKDDNNGTVLHLTAGKMKPVFELEDVTYVTDERNLLIDRSDSFYLFLKEGKKILPPKNLRNFLTAKDKNGRTCLHLAADAGNVEAVKLILQEAEECLPAEDLEKFIMAKDAKKQTAVEISISNEEKVVTDLLSAFMEEKFNGNIVVDSHFVRYKKALFSIGFLRRLSRRRR